MGLKSRNKQYIQRHSTKAACPQRQYTGEVFLTNKESRDNGFEIITVEANSTKKKYRIDLKRKSLRYMNDMRQNYICPFSPTQHCVLCK